MDWGTPPKKAKAALWPSRKASIRSAGYALTKPASECGRSRQKKWGSFRDPGCWCWKVGASCYQGGDKLAEQGFATAAGVMHELEEAEIERQLLLRDASVRP